MNQFQQQFNELNQKLTHQPQWLTDRRNAGFDIFSQTGFPTRKNELWKYLNLKELVESHFELPQISNHNVQSLMEKAKLGGLNGHLIVFVNGYFSKELSNTSNLDNQVRLVEFHQALSQSDSNLENHLGLIADNEKNPFVALNTAFIHQGLLIHIPKNVVVENPIQLVFITTPNLKPIMTHPRLLIIAEPNSKVDIVESYHGTSTYFTNSVLEINLAENSKLNHYKFQQESSKAFHISNLQVYQNKDSSFGSHSVSIGAHLSRNDIYCMMDAQGAACELNGLYLGSFDKQVDYHTRIDHLKPQTHSQQLFKGICDDSSKAIFDGLVVIHPQAQKSEAHQQNRNLLLSDKAEVNPKPQLEIYADDVKASHGATVGQLDDNSLFYLRSRGLNENQAKGLLTYAFASDLINQIPHHLLKCTFNLLVGQFLGYHPPHLEV